ncbi:MAG: redoxin domain-containing protein [candidate division Zixibacteria bacterium]|nr:redoxin domain-containing protein [candidate division Zixibacteria bacterium]
MDIGDRAPNFELKNQRGEIVTLESFKGSKILLAFYPFSFSSVCTSELSCFRDDLSQFKNKNVTVIGVSVDSHHTQRAYAESLKIEYPLLSDFGRKASTAYGVLRAEGCSERAYFVIDESGIITFRSVMDRSGKTLDTVELLNAIN